MPSTSHGTNLPASLLESLGDECDTGSLGNSGSSAEGFSHAPMPVPPRVGGAAGGQTLTSTTDTMLPLSTYEPQTPLSALPNTAWVQTSNVQAALGRLVAARPPKRATQCRVSWEVHIVGLCRQKSGAQFLQSKIESGTDEERQSIFEAIVSDPRIDARDIVSDQFGNYVVQKLLKRGTPVQRKGLGVKIIRDAVFLAVHMYGCRVLQCALDVLEEEDRHAIITELSKGIVKIVKDQHGNHVVQKCIESVPAATTVITYMLKGIFCMISKHIYGCRIVERILAEYAKRGETTGVNIELIMKELFHNVEDLISDQYGNYVIQYILTTAESRFSSVLVENVKRNFFRYSTQKYASNVVEKCFSVLGSADKMALLRPFVTLAPVYALVAGGTCDVPPANPSAAESMLVYPLIAMSSDQFGNYVVQKISELADERMLHAILNIARAGSQELAARSYGKAVLQKLMKICEDRRVPMPMDLRALCMSFHMNAPLPSHGQAATQTQTQPQPQPQPQVQTQPAQHVFSQYTQPQQGLVQVPVQLAPQQAVAVPQGYLVHTATPWSGYAHHVQHQHQPQHQTTIRSVSASSVGSLQTVQHHTHTHTPQQPITTLYIPAVTQPGVMSLGHPQQQVMDGRNVIVVSDIPALISQEETHEEKKGNVDWSYPPAKDPLEKWPEKPTKGLISVEGYIYVDGKVFDVNRTIGSLKATIARDQNCPVSSVSIRAQSDTYYPDDTEVRAVGAFVLATPFSHIAFLPPLSFGEAVIRN